MIEDFVVIFQMFLLSISFISSQVFLAISEVEHWPLEGSVVDGALVITSLRFKARLTVNKASP